MFLGLDLVNYFYHSEKVFNSLFSFCFMNIINVVADELLLPLCEAASSSSSSYVLKCYPFPLFR